ncbi:MAG TPA: translation elongation factor Ts [Candidatus Baltobacteraceae bacterium]|nr:translation elongation factor Ts [Candidatus Baltobacteraceae bacterium]
MIDAKSVSELRAMTGAGIVESKKALDETGGDMAAAAELLRKKGIIKAGSKSDRQTSEGLVYAYVHGNGKMGAMVEVLCETDFVARTDGFRELCHALALQIAAMNPLYVSSDSIPPEVVEKEKEIYAEEFVGSNKPAEMVAKIVEGKLGKWYSEVCLLKQAYIKDEDKSVEDVVKETIAKCGENIQVKRFVRYAMDSHNQVPG